MVHHIGLTVSNVERSASFYMAYFGMDEHSRWTVSGEAVSRVVAVPNAAMMARLLVSQDERTLLELVQYTSPVGQSYGLRNCDVGASHLCFAVEDLAGLTAKMKADGVKFNAEAVELMEGTPTVYLEDPDGINLEILQPGPGWTHDDLLAHRRSRGSSSGA